MAEIIRNVFVYGIQLHIYKKEISLSAFPFNLVEGGSNMLYVVIYYY